MCDRVCVRRLLVCVVVRVCVGVLMRLCVACLVCPVGCVFECAVVWLCVGV